MWRRALVVWLVIIVVETVHGILRRAFLVPVVGDLPSRQIGVVIGSALVFAVALIFGRWLGARTLRAQLAVGALWTVPTVCFELALGAALGLTRERMLADYDFARGGYMSLGLLFMLLTPALAARVRGVGNGGTR